MLFSTCLRTGRYLVVLSVLVLGISTAAVAQERREWAVGGDNEQIVITDCQDCGDDIGMMVECRGKEQPAKVTVHWAASNTGQEGERAPVIIEVDGQAFERDATTIYMGQIGYLPRFQLTPDDPMVEALQAGSNVDVTFGPARVRISLRGSRGAIDIFKAHCGWNRLPANN